MQVKPGDLVKFGVVSRLTPNINNKIALYIGKDLIPHRDDGLIIKNHKILIAGESTPLLIDHSLLHHMKKLYQTNETNEKVREML